MITITIDETTYGMSEHVNTNDLKLAVIHELERQCEPIVARGDGLYFFEVCIQDSKK